MDHPQRPLLAIPLRLCSILLVATMMMLVKLSKDSGMPMPEILFWRQAIPTVGIFLMLAATGRTSVLKTDRLGSHARRALIGMIGMVGLFVSVSILPLAVSSTLTFTAPLFAVIITATVLRHFVGIWRWTAVLLGFAGVLVITQPGGSPVSPIGAAGGLTSGLVVAIVGFLVRDLARTEAPIRIVFYFSLFGLLAVGVVAPFYMTVHTPLEWILLGGIGVAGGGAQWLSSISLRYASVLTVMIFDYSLLIWSTLIGWVVWDALPPAATWLGAPAIIVAGMIITWREHRARQTVMAASRGSSSVGS